VKIEVLQSFLKNTINAQNEQAQLAAVLKSTGRAASMGVGELNKMAAAMARATTFSAGDVNQAQATLLAFTGIAGKEFPRAMQAAADMAARTGMTIKAAAETIGRSLDVPSQGLSSLSRQGFRFTDAQKELVKQLEDTGRTAEAQAIVLGALEESYGGAAKAARDTLGGALAALRNTISDLLTDQNGSLEGLRLLVERLNEALGSEAARDGMQKVIVASEALALVIGTRLAASVLKMVANFAVANASAGFFSVTVTKVAGASTAATVGLTSLSVAARAANVALALVGGPIGAIILALGGAAWAWNQYGKDARSQASAGVLGLADTKLSIEELVASFQKLSSLRRKQLIDVKTEDLQKAVRESQQALSALGNAFEPGMSKGLKGAAKFRADFAAEVRGIVSDTNLSADQMDHALSGLIDSYIASGRASESKRKSLNDLAIKLVEASGKVSGLRSEVEALTRAQTEAANSFAPVVDELDRYRIAYEKFMKDFATPDERFKDAVKQKREELGPLFNDNALKRIRDRYLPKSSGAAAQTSELENLTKRLEEQRATLGMTADAAERWRIEQAKASAAHRARALALFDEVQAWKEAEDATRKAAESARTFAAIQHEIDLYRQGREVEIAGIDLSDRQRELMEQEISIRQQYAERRRELEEAQQVESTRLAESAYRARLDALSAAENQQVQILLESAARKQEAEQSWLSGFARGFGNYADTAKNVVASVERSVVSAFQGMEDALLNFVTKGKFDFRSLADSIIKDMIRIAIQQSITAPLAKMFGGMIGGMFGAGSGSGYPAHGGNWSFDSGGYTGGGGKYEPAGIVHRGEGVLNQEEIRALGGESGFNALRRAIRGPGHAAGGMAGRPALPPLSPALVPMRAGDVNVTVNVSGNGATQTEAPNGWQQFAKEIGDFIDSRVREHEIKSQRQGGTAWQYRQGAFA